MNSIKALYRAGDLLALTLDPTVLCWVVQNQGEQDQHVRVRRLGQLEDEWIREADLTTQVVIKGEVACAVSAST